MLGAIILGLVFLLRRNRRAHAPAATPAPPITEQQYPPTAPAHMSSGPMSPISMSPPMSPPMSPNPLPAYETYDKPTGVESAHYDNGKGGYNPHMGQSEVSEVAGSSPQPLTQPYSATPVHGAELPANNHT